MANAKLNYIRIFSSYHAVNTLRLGYMIANDVLLGALQRFTKAFFNLNTSRGVPAHTTCNCSYACIHHFDETHEHSAASNYVQISYMECRTTDGQRSDGHNLICARK